jgi:DnaJ-class molecular chaperone
MAKCERCDGKGRIECPLEYGVDDHPENCPACWGSNWVECTECDGSGRSYNSSEDDD